MGRHSYTYKSLNRSVGKAIHRYEMIEDGDRIAVGVSGGIDSLTLLWILHERLKRINISYKLFPIYIDPGFEGGSTEALKDYCRKMGCSLIVDKTTHGVLAHSSENLENPCFLCSKLRRKRLFEIAGESGCSKLSLGHNMDDIIETLFINMFYAGQISTMVPSQILFKGKFTIIRPLAFVDKNRIKSFAKVHGFPDFANPCPSAKKTKRFEMKNMLNQIYKTNKKIKGNIFRALSNVKEDYMLK